MATSTAVLANQLELLRAGVQTGSASERAWTAVRLQLELGAKGVVCPICKGRGYVGRWKGERTLSCVL